MFNYKTYKAYLDSSKPKVVLLMIFTSFIGMLLADPLRLNFEILILGNLGIVFNVFVSRVNKSIIRSKIDS